MSQKEQWNSLVKEVEKAKTAREDAVQSLWEDIFSDTYYFGYSRRKGEVDAHRSIQIGSGMRTIPDIIIRDAENRTDLFVVELKQHCARFDESYKQQLFSYMRLLGLSVGILICDRLHLYYCINSSKAIDLSIDFTQDNELGVQFLQLFSKGNFNPDTVRQFIESHKKREQHIDAIVQSITPDYICAVLKKELMERYTADEIEAALGKLDISVRPFRLPILLTVDPVPPRRPKQPKGPDIPDPDPSVYVEPDFDYIIIKTTEERIALCNGSLYEATRFAWRLKVERARQYPYVFSVVNKIVRAVYKVHSWKLVTSGELAGRYEFFGEEATPEISKQFVGKMIPDYYRVAGNASPIQYKRGSLRF